MDPATLKAIQIAIETALKAKPVRYFIIGLALLIFCVCTYGITFFMLIITVSQVPKSILNVPSINNTQTDTVDVLTASSQLVSFIESQEGYMATPYRGVDSQNLTIGYGHVIEPGENYTYLTQPQAEALLMNDLTIFEASVQNEFRSVSLTQSQFDALVDLCYNLGPNIWNSINLTDGVLYGAPANTIENDFLSLDHVNGAVVQGLLNRRENDFQMYEYGYYPGIV